MLGFAHQQTALGLHSMTRAGAVTLRIGRVNRSCSTSVTIHLAHTLFALLDYRSCLPVRQSDCLPVKAIVVLASEKDY